MERNIIVKSLLLAVIVLLAIWSCDRGEGARENAAADEESPSTYHLELGDEIPPEELSDTTNVELKDDAPAGSDNPLGKFEYTWTDSDDMPDIVIVVDDFGSSGALLEDYAKLPSEVVFAVLPDLAHTKRSGEIAAQYNHEVLIHMPMQPESTSENPGEKYVKTTDSEETIKSLIADFYKQLPMAIGANNHMGSAATANREAMQAVLKNLHSKGMFFLDSATTAKSVSASIARTNGYPALKRDVFLDVPDSKDATLAKKIESLKNYKGRREPVIIITHCHNREKLKALQNFIEQIKGMGLRLTTLSRARQLAA